MWLADGGDESYQIMIVHTGAKAILEKALDGPPSRAFGSYPHFERIDAADHQRALMIDSRAGDSSPCTFKTPENPEPPGKVGDQLEPGKRGDLIRRMNAVDTSGGCVLRSLYKCSFLVESD